MAPRTARDGGEPLVPPRPGAARPTGRATTRRPGPRGTCICCARVGGTGAERLPQPYGTALSARLPVPRAFPETALPAHALRLRLRGRGALAGRTGRRVPCAARAAQGGGDRAEPGRSLRPDPGVDSRKRKDLRVDSTLRLIVSNPVDRLARTIEALLVVAAAPLSVADLADAAEDDPERIETALGLLRERYAEGRSGIVLEHVAGGYAFRAARESADACARIFERPVERGLSQAALETLAIVAYVGPCSRPEIARIRGVAADSAVASLIERGLIVEAGREHGPGGAVRYRTTPLFERVFGLESLAALPRLDDLGEADDLRRRLLDVASAKAS
ncbi:MAG: SMC-Scp complex subunit ScpB [Actinobacteria bacterium]|nr:MAG: SMC-Scp complex subunit ScpB [Actinomycetota bacterium]